MPIDAPLIVLIIFVALAFDFNNGFHDAANSIATVVSTRVLSPRKAVVWAAFFNFVAAFVLGSHVADERGVDVRQLLGGDAGRHVVRDEAGLTSR